MARRWNRFWAEPRPRARKPDDKVLRRRLGRAPDPVSASGRNLASTFWGRAWCDNLERYHDFENRLPRGRTYLRKGAILDLQVASGHVTAVVIGSELYDVRIHIDPVPPRQFSALRERCAGGLSSVVALLEGRIGDDVMAAVTERRTGLFPEPSQIHMSCSCPDWATMCKHVAAVLYGVGVRLDREPELLFTLRGVHPDALLGDAGGLTVAVAPSKPSPGLEAADLSAIFGVTIDDAPSAPAGRPVREPPEVHAWDSEEAGEWTLAELAARTGRSLNEIVAYALGATHPRVNQRHASPPSAKRASSRPSPPRPSNRRAFEVLVLHTLRDAGGHMALAELRAHVGGSPMQVRAALNRLIDRGEVSWSGKARATRYWAR